MLRLYQQHVPRHAVSKVWKCMYALEQIPVSEDGLKHTQREIRNRPDRHFFLIPLVITHGAYVSVGHLSLEPSKDIVHHCMLNGFI